MNTFLPKYGILQHLNQLIVAFFQVSKLCRYLLHLILFQSDVCHHAISGHSSGFITYLIIADFELFGIIIVLDDCFPILFYNSLLLHYLHILFMLLLVELFDYHPHVICLLHKLFDLAFEQFEIVMVIHGVLRVFSESLLGIEFRNGCEFIILGWLS